MNPPAGVKVTDPQGVHGTIDIAACERVDRECNEPHSQGQEESHGEDRDRTL
jgi:hypothetical protein